MEHLGEVVEGVAVLAGGDVAAEGRPDLAEAGEVVGGHRLLEPGDVVLIGQHVTEADSLFDAVAAVGVDVEFGVTDDLAGQSDSGEVAVWDPNPRTGRS